MPGTGNGNAANGQAAAGATATRLRLVEQTPWVRTGEPFAVRVAVDRPPVGATLDAAVFGALDDPDAVATTARGEDLGRRLASLPAVPVPAATAGTDGVVVRFTVGPEQAGSDRLDLEPGVYPVAVDLLDAAGERVDRLVTHVVVTDPAAARRPVALVVRLDQPFRIDAAGRLQLSGSPTALNGAVEQLRQDPDVPVTLVATPGALAAVATDSTGASAGSSPDTAARTAAALQALDAQAQVVNVPFASLPAGAWVAAGLDQPIIEQMDGGVEALTSTFGAPPTGTVWLLGPTDNPLLLRWLAARGVKAFLVPDDTEDTSGTDRDDAPGGSATGASTNGTAEHEPPAEPFRIEQVEPEHVGLRAEHVGPDVGRPPEEPSTPVADAYRLLARLAVGAAETPAAGATGTAAASLDPSVLLLDDLSTAGLTYLSTLLGALDQDGPLAPQTVETVRLGIEQALGEGSTGEQGTTAELEPWTLPERTQPDLTALGADLRSASQAVDSLAGVVGTDDPTVALLHRTVLTMGGQDMSVPERHDLATHVWASAQESLAGIDLGDDQPVTVTAHRTNLPLTVHNGGNRTLDVVVRLDSTDLELQGATAVPLRLAPGDRVDVNVPVEISRAGDFRLRTRVTSPDGQLQLAERVVTVRSTAISGVGVVLSLGALVFLFVWWGRQVRRKRRQRAAAATAVAAAPPPVAVPVPHQPVDEPVP